MPFVFESYVTTLIMIMYEINSKLVEIKEVLDKRGEIKSIRGILQSWIVFQKY